MNAKSIGRGLYYGSALLLAGALAMANPQARQIAEKAKGRVSAFRSTGAKPAPEKIVEKVAPKAPNPAEERAKAVNEAYNATVACMNNASDENKKTLAAVLAVHMGDSEFMREFFARLETKLPAVALNPANVAGLRGGNAVAELSGTAKEIIAAFRAMVTGMEGETILTNKAIKAKKDFIVDAYKNGGNKLAVIVWLNRDYKPENADVKSAVTPAPNAAQTCDNILKSRNAVSSKLVGTAAALAESVETDADEVKVTVTVESGKVSGVKAEGIGGSVPSSFADSLKASYSKREESGKLKLEYPIKAAFAFNVETTPSAGGDLPF